jgi:hypothetical protein
MNLLDYVGALVEQQLDDSDVPVVRGPVQRRPSVYTTSLVDVGAPVERRHPPLQSPGRLQALVLTRTLPIAIRYHHPSTSQPYSPRPSTPIFEGPCPKPCSLSFAHPIPNR